MKLKKVLAGVMVAVTAVTASVCGLSVSAGAYADIDISGNYDVLKSGRKKTLTLEPRQNASTSETVVYKFPVSKSGTFHMDISSDTYYVKASFVKKGGIMADLKEEVDNEGITVLMTEGECFNRYNGEVNFIWDWSSRRSEGSCEFSVDPGEYLVGFTVEYNSKGNGDVPFDKLKDEFGSGKITFTVTYPYDETYADKSDDTSTDDYSPYNIKYLGIDEILTRDYTGKAIKPSVKIYSEIIDMQENHIKTYLVEGTDYTLSYKNNTKPGQATVIITGKGDYSGTRELTFYIVPKKVKVTSKKSGSQAVLIWKKSAGAAGYEIYSSVDGGKFKKLTTTKNVKYTAKLTAGKSYKFKVRPYATVNGKKIYGKWSNTVSV